MALESISILKNKNIDIPSLISVLNSAYADEILATLQYFTGLQNIKGAMRKEISEELEAHYKEEYHHAELLAGRIVELGGRVLLSPQQIIAQSSAGYTVPDKDSSMSILTQNLQSERKAIQIYDALLCNEVLKRDVKTKKILREILSDEIEHEQDLESLQYDYNDMVRCQNDR